MLFKTYYKILNCLKRLTTLIQSNCLYCQVVYSTGYCVCLQHGLQMCTKASQNICLFYKVQEETCFYSNEKFTSIKLTGDETFFLVSMLFKLNETTNIRTANREQSDLYRGLHLTSQHTHKHTLIHVFGNSYCIS